MSDIPTAGPRRCRALQPPTVDFSGNAPLLFAQATPAPAGGAADASAPPSDARRREQLEELSAALRHSDFTEAARVDGKYRFSLDERLVVNLEAFRRFFEEKKYEKASAVAQWNKPSMEAEYQDAFQAWYKEKLFSPSYLPEQVARTCGHSGEIRRGGKWPTVVHFCSQGFGNDLNEDRFSAACRDAYRQSLMWGRAGIGREIADFCKLNVEERTSPCPDAYRNIVAEGELGVADIIAEHCGWNATTRNTVIEGFIDSLAGSDLDLALRVAKKYGLYYKAEVLQKRKDEAEHQNGKAKKETGERKIRKAVLLKKATPLILADGGGGARVWATRVDSLPWSIHPYSDALVRNMLMVSCALMCNGGQDEAKQLRQLGGELRWAPENITEQKCVEEGGTSCLFWGKTREEIAKLGRKQVQQAAMKRREEEKRQTEAEEREEENEAAIVAQEEERRAREEEKRQRAEDLAEEGRKKAEEAEERKRDAAEAEEGRRRNFIDALTETNFEEARRLRKEGGWSQGVLRSLVDRALKRVTTFPIDSCDRAQLIYKEYKSVGGLCVPKRTKWSIKEGSCQIECN